MKKVAASLAIGFVLAGTSAVQASSEQGQQVVECKTQLTAVYGDDAHVRTIGKISVRESAMTFSVHPQGERHLRVTCTRMPNGNISMMDRYGIALVMPEQQGKKAWDELF